MSVKKPPVESTNVYSMSKMGVYGELGHGANAHVRFIQSVITPEDLGDLTLISRIPGSLQWDVKDLFQRDVDYERVKNDIIPYLKDNAKVKFFNPLTLVLLPMDVNGKDVLKKIEFLPKSSVEISGAEYEVYEKKDYYQLRIFKGEQFAEILWNRHKCHLVAIDGQHRLSALKRIWESPQDAGVLDGWKIPVVILTINKAKEGAQAAGLLEIVRKTFVYINTQAVRVNTARKILLNDESTNAICTQEIIQLSHSNDNKSFKDRDPKILPLLFWNWRGETIDGKDVASPAAVKDIEELHAWFENYIFREDGSARQEAELGVTDLIPKLDNYGPKRALSHNDAERIRELFQSKVMPALMRFLQEFSPFKCYIAKCYEMEKKALEASDIAQHAFVKLRFGNYTAGEDLQDAIAARYKEIVEEIEEAKRACIPPLILREIGMRAIVYALCEVKEDLTQSKGKQIDWAKYVDLVIGCFNEIYDDGWFKSYDGLEKKKREILTHVAFDGSGSIINYKLEQAEDALGALVAILLFKKLLDLKKASSDDFENAWGRYGDGLRKTVERGFKKYYRSLLKDTFNGTVADFTKEISKRAAESAERMMVVVRRYIGVE